MKGFNIWQLLFLNLSYVVLHLYFNIGGLYQVLYATFWVAKNVFKLVVQAIINDTTIFKSFIQQIKDDSAFQEV